MFSLLIFIVLMLDFSHEPQAELVHLMWQRSVKLNILFLFSHFFPFYFITFL